MLKYNSRLPRRVIYLERYRSGHNEAVLKTVCPQGRVGSNPTLSVEKNRVPVALCFFQSSLKVGFEQGEFVDYNISGERWRSRRGRRGFVFARDLRQLMWLKEFVSITRNVSLLATSVMSYSIETQLL